jgi:hypothetical protein
MSRATFTFGRFNVPTEEGHGKLIKAVQAHAEKTGGSHYIFPSHSQDAKKNPLDHGQKIGFMQRLFPNANIVSQGKVRTAIDAMKHLEKKGHTHVTMVVGSDRVSEFNSLLNKYRKKEFPGVKSVKVISGGNRDPDAEGAEGMSASKLRDLIRQGKRKEFISHYSDSKLGAQLHDAAKKGMQMESKTPIGIFLLGGPGSGKDYVLNNIFSRFDLTEVQIEHILNGAAQELIESNQNIVINGAIDEEKMAIAKQLLEGYSFDHVFVSVTNRVSRNRNAMRDNPLDENKRLEKWYRVEKLTKSLDEVFTFNNSINLNESSEMERVFFGNQIEKLLSRMVESGLEMKQESEPKTFTLIREKKFPAVAKDKESGLPKKYVSGLSTSTAKARKAHWKKMSKYSDKDPRAYEPAPGDATAETKPSKHTLAVRKMMGEQIAADVKPPHTVEQIAKKHKVSEKEILKALEAGKKVEKEHTNDDATAEIIALAHLWERPDYYEMLMKMEAIRRVPRSGNITAVKAKRELNAAERAGFERAQMAIATSKVQEEKLSEAADSSLSAKAKKSGISVSTLRKVYKRGVAAWNSGHRPGTTPQQWGHARVNSYINKGKTYHTADKDLREENNLDVIFERQLVGTDEYRKHAIAMTPGQGEPVDAFPVKSPNKKPVAVPAKAGKSIVSQYTEHTECGTPNCCGECGTNTEIRRTNESIVSKSFKSIRGTKSEKEVVDVTPNLITRKKKSVNNPQTYNSTLAGLMVSPKHSMFEETSLEEAIQYHIDNKISFTENIFRPGSEKFFEMLKEAKRLYKEGKYEPENEYEKDLLDSDVGEYAAYEGTMVPLDFPFEENLNEADDPTDGKGIGKPWREGGGGAVYVRTGDGGVKKVRFSQSGMKKKFMDPAATRSFVARHRCLTNKDKTSASYWACRYPRFFSKSGKIWW